MTSQTKLKQTARQCQIEERRRQVSIMIAQGMTEVAIAGKLGVDNTTISKDVKALKLISKQFIYDITKSDFTYYYKQCLDAVKLILRKQCEIVDKERITKEDVWRAKILVDMLNTFSTINNYYEAAPDMHQSAMQKVLSEERFGVRPGTKTMVHHVMVDEDEEMKTLEEWDAIEEAEREAELKGLK
jgi:IS30 family transposase